MGDGIFLNDRYRMGDLLGEGGMGRVFRAQDLRLQRDVAIKFLPRIDKASMVERFRAEAMAVARLNHPNIVTVFDYDYLEGNHAALSALGLSQNPPCLPGDDLAGELQRGQPFIVMEYLPGKSIREAELSDAVAILDVGLALCDALDYAHREGIVHRDVKPDNIRITDDGRVKLLDFGIASFCHRRRITLDGEVLGSLVYMSPEQALSEPIDARSDIYALGLVLYELLAGRLPFDVSSPMRSLEQRTSGTLPGLRKFCPKLPLALEQVLARALARQPEGRYATASDFGQALREVRDAMAQSMANATTFGRYELIKLLAVGGMGEIYLARVKGPANFEKRCVIKKILPHLATEEEFVTKFIDEANTVVQLTHGNIVPVFDMGEHQGEYFIAMDYIPGVNLRTLLKARAQRQSPLPVAMCIHLLCEVCKGLSYAHRKCGTDGQALGIIHRDISPSNILVSLEGEVRLVDFGIAKATSRITRSVTGRLQGKFGYMSPEQASGAPLDLRSDIFSAGVVLYECLTGARPFEGESDLASLEAVKSHEAAAPSTLRPGIAKELDQIVAKALAKKPADRFANADDFLDALLKFLVTTGQHVTPQDLAKEVAADMDGGDDAMGGAACLDALLGQEVDRLIAAERRQSAQTLTATADSNRTNDGAALLAPLSEEDTATLSSPGQTPTAPPRDEPSPAPKRQGSRRWRWLAALLLVGLVLFLGQQWLAQRSGQAPQQITPAAAAAAAAPEVDPEEADVEPPQVPAQTEPVARWHSFDFVTSPEEALMVVQSGLADVDHSADLVRLNTSRQASLTFSAEGYAACTLDLQLAPLMGEPVQVPVLHAKGCLSAYIAGGSPLPDGTLSIAVQLAKLDVVVEVAPPDSGEGSVANGSSRRDGNGKRPKEGERSPRALAVTVRSNVEATVSLGDRSGAAPFTAQVNRGQDAVQIKVTPRGLGLPWQRSFDPASVERGLEQTEMEARFCPVVVHVVEPRIPDDPAPYGVADVYVGEALIARGVSRASFVVPCGRHKVSLRYRGDDVELQGEALVDASSDKAASASIAMQRVR